MKFLLTTVLILLVFVASTLMTSTNSALTERESGSYWLGVSLVLDRLKETRAQKRIILLGGSSLGWGVSGEQMTQELGVLTINTGVDAGFGYENIWKIFAPFINSQDIIVISPEYAMIANGGGTINRLMCRLSVLGLTDKWIDVVCIGRHFKRIFMNLVFDPPSLVGDYMRDGFNEFGDYILHVSGDREVKGPSSMCGRLPTNDELAAYIEYFDAWKAAGYKLLFVPTVTYEGACGEYLPRILEINGIIAEHFASQVPDGFPYLLEEKHFFDTNYHLNRSGIDLKTQFFIEAIRTNYPLF
jgi:hypothetical protein